MRWKRIGIGAAAAVALAAAGWWVGGPDGGSAGAEIEATGTVEATEADLGFRSAGRIASVAVAEGDAVRAGAELAMLDRAELEARRAEAQARVSAAWARLDELRSGSRPEELAQARAALAAAERRHRDARRDLARTGRLHEGGAVSLEALENAETAVELAEAEREQAAERLRLLEAGPRAERIAAAEAEVGRAEAAAARVDALLEDAVVRAPFAGVVTVRHREPGETVAPGQPVITLMNPDDRWIRIYVPEDRVGRLSIGQQATITADGYPDRSYPGRVSFIADEAEFTPRDVQTTEERTRLVYAVRVALARDPDRDLKPGLPADVRLEAGAAPLPEGAMPRPNDAAPPLDDAAPPAEEVGALRDGRRSSRGEEPDRRRAS